MDHYSIHINLCSINVLRTSFLWSFANWPYSFGSARFILLWSWVIWWATVFFPIISLRVSVLFLNWTGPACSGMAVTSPGSEPHCYILATVLCTDVLISHPAGHRCTSVLVYGKVTERKATFNLEEWGKTSSALESARSSAIRNKAIHRPPIPTL